MKMSMFLVLVLILSVGMGKAGAADPIGTVVAVQGAVKAIDTVGAARVLDMKSPVFLLDRIETGAGAKVQILFQDDSLFSMGENSEASIDEYVYNPKVKDDNNLMIRILKGIARIVTGGITDLNPDRFKIKTGRASIGIRGCDLGFQIDPDMDRIYIVRIPEGRGVQIRPVRSGQAGAFKDIEESGVLIRVWDDGRMDQLDLTPEWLRHLATSTTPGPEALLRHRPESLPAEQTPPRDSEEADLRMPDRQPADRTPLWNPDPTPQENAFVVVQDRTLEEHQLVEPEEEATPSADSVVRPDSTDNTELPPIPEPILRLSGGGVGGLYDAGTPPGLHDIFLYRAERGVIGAFQTGVDFSGRHLDADGNLIGVPTLSLKEVPLLRFGSSTRYEGYRINNALSDVTLANDNLRQFVRYIDRAHPDTRMMWWGYEAAGFPGSKLPSRSVVSYDSMIVYYPRVIDPSAIPPYQEISKNDLKVNTRTGAFYVQLPDGHKVFGKAGDLTFYGQESQGVGVSRFNPNARESGPAAIAAAGFKDPGSIRPAESGGWVYRGYAIGSTILPGATPGPADAYCSIDPLSDTASDNEGRVTIALNKGAINYENVGLNIRVQQNPSVPGTEDLVFDRPDHSFYVDGNDALAVYDRPGKDLEVQIQEKGQDWNWGEWNGEVEVDTGTGTEDRETHGEVVAGRTLDPSDFQALVMGGVSYILHTPTARPGVANGLYTFGSDAIKFAGNCRLNVTILGGGSTPTWSGDFEMESRGGDTLLMSVPTSFISPNGHLQGNPSPYQLDVDGRSYNEGQIQPGGGMTGSLVGPGRGPVPVTGAIGEGHFQHNDGSTMNIVYGTDLE